MRTRNWFWLRPRRRATVTACGLVLILTPAANAVCDAGLDLLFLWTPPDRLDRKVGDWEAELDNRVSGQGRSVAGGESAKYWSKFGNGSIEWTVGSGMEEVVVSICGVDSGSWVPRSMLDARSVCATGVTEAGGPEGLSEVDVATAAAGGGSVAGCGTRDCCGPGWSEERSPVSVWIGGRAATAGWSCTGPAGGLISAAGSTAAANVRGAFGAFELVVSAGQPSCWPSAGDNA